MTDLNRKLRWLIAVRLLIVVSITGPYGLSRLNALLSALGGDELGMPEGQRDLALLHLVFIACVQTLVYIGLLRFLRSRPTVHAYIQFSGDLLVVTYLMYRLGEAGQSFSILYFVVVSVASVLVRRSAGIVVATLAALFYTVMVWSPEWAPFVRLLERFDLTSPMATMAPPIRIYNQSVHLAGFYVIALLTAYLARDITVAEERLRVKQFDLAYLEVVHRDVVQSISSGLVTTDLNGIIISLNKSAEKIFGVKGNSLVGVHVTETGLFEEEQWLDLIEQSADGASRREVETDREGQAAFLGVTLSHLRDAESERRGYILVVEDLTQEHRLREQLRVKDRMAAVGQMATKLAHEVGNPLAAISGSVQVLARSFEGDTSQQKLLQITLKESQRLDRTVKSFLQLASSRQRRFEPIDIAALIAEDVELLKNSEEVHDRHQIECALDPASALIRADPDQIGQIFWNLARNALQAMPGGGIFRVNGKLNGAWYRLEFQDTGTGMTDEAKADLFHPFKSFFDQGTGIGMAIVFRIVEEHGGKIDAKSEPGEGTVIHIELPVAGPDQDQRRLV